MGNFTPAQVAAIKGWTEQRDALFRDIAAASPELERIQKETVDAGANLAAHHVSIGEARGRLAELVALEERARTSIPLDIAELEARKSRLQSECAELDTKIADGRKLYDFTVEATGVVQSQIGTMKDQAAIVNSVTGEIIETSKTHLSDTKEKASEIKAVFDTVIDRANENLSQSKIVIEKLPKFIFDMQRPIPVRRTYPVGHPNAPVIES